MDVATAYEGGHPLPDLVTVEPGMPRVSSLSEKAYYLLRDRLITLDLAPGTPIDERALKDELGVGRTPIREALRKLADDRLVIVVPRRGVFASHADLGDLRAISEIRVELEGSAGRLAALRAKGPDVATADNLLSDLRSMTTTTDRRDSIRLDQRVHRLVHRATYNAFLTATLEEYYLHSLRMWFLVLDRLPHLDHALGDHIDLLVAIQDGDAESAERVMRRHVADFEQMIRAAL